MATVRAIRERQEAGLEVKCFSARVPVTIYNSVTDWAWEHRISLAKALTLLLADGLRTNGRIVSESGGVQDGKQSD